MVELLILVLHEHEGTQARRVVMGFGKARRFFAVVLQMQRIAWTSMHFCVMVQWEELHCWKLG